MEEIKIFLKDILAKSGSKNALYKRNLLREYLQVLVLDFIIGFLRRFLPLPLFWAASFI